MTKSYVERLKEALDQAISQCTQHNEEYHHRTSGEQLATWKKLLRESATSPDLAPVTERELKLKLKAAFKATCKLSIGDEVATALLDALRPHLTLE